MRVPRTTAAIVVVTLSLLVTGCGKDPGSAAPAAKGPAATATPPTPAGNQQPVTAPARPGPGETTVACSPSACGIHFVGQTLSFGPVYAFTAKVGGVSYPAFRVDNVRLSIDPGNGTGLFGDGALGLTDNQYNSTGQGDGPTSTELARSNPACLSPLTAGYRGRYDVAPGTPLTLPKGVCFGFPNDRPPVVATTLKYFDGYPIPLTPAGR